MIPAVDQLLAQAVERGAVPSVVALAANAQGILYAGAFGRRDLDVTG